MKNRKIWVMLVGLFTALTSGFMGTTLTFAEENEASQTIEQPSYISDFPNQVGHWQDLVGTAEKKNDSTGLWIANTKQGTNLESVSINLDAREQSSGDLELTSDWFFAEINKRRVNGNLLLIIVTAAGN